jgi:type IV secretion system protein VirB10
MSQNQPPVPPNDPREEHDDVVANPYYARHQEREAPDLDAGAPELRNAENQRLNRKALGFLAAIVGVLLIFVVLVFNSRGKDDKPRAKREEVVAVPDAKVLPPPVEMPQPAQPIAVEPNPPLPPMPEPPDPAPLPSGMRGADRPREPSLLERRILASAGSGQSENGMEGGGAPGQSGAPGQNQTGPIAAAVPDTERPTSARFIQKPNALLVRGTYIRCVLESRIISDFGGFTSCIVTEPVYSINGYNLLLPKGSKVLGSYRRGASGGTERIEVIWDRITTPSGIDVNMASPGVDNLGGSGVPGQYDAHWARRITSALLISMVADAFKYAAAENGPPSYGYSGAGVVVQNPYESSTARTMERLANDALTENMRRPPTVTVNQGTIINVYVAKDVDFSGVVSLY